MISIVIPVHNEEENVEVLRHEIEDAIFSENAHEIIFVDDGSTDGTKGKIDEMRQKHGDTTQSISFAKRLGKAKALVEGFKHASGEIVVTMDGDLQDDPRDIPKMVKALEEYDVVVGWRKNRRDGVTKTMPSKIYNTLSRRVFGLRIHDLNCGFKAYRRRVIDDVKVYGDMHRYLPILAMNRGYGVGEVEVNHRPRKHGKSKYGVWRLYSGFLDLLTVKFITSYGEKPMHFFGAMATMLFLLGTTTGAYILYQKYINDTLIVPENLPLMLFAITSTLISLTLFAIGYLGELIQKR